MNDNIKMIKTERISEVMLPHLHNSRRNHLRHVLPVPHVIHDRDVVVQSKYLCDTASYKATASGNQYVFTGYHLR